MYFLPSIVFRIARFGSFLKSALRFSFFSIIRVGPKGKLGASINLFDGEELLLDLIYSVRSEVDYLSVVFQESGHWGETKAHPCLSSFLFELKNEGLIDELYLWCSSVSPSDVEQFNSLDMLKRQKGLELARDNDCTHYLNLDNDELYTKRGLRYMKRVMMSKFGTRYDYSVLRHLQYYKNASYIRRKKEQEYVMGIFPIKDLAQFEYGAQSEYPIDPGRKISGSKVVEFWRYEVCMHHLTYVRSDIRTKLISAHSRDGNLLALERIIQRYENYTFPQTGYWGHGLEVELKRVKPKISTIHFESNSFEKFASGMAIKEITQGKS
jgi:hypothetical protein